MDPDEYLSVLKDVSLTHAQFMSEPKTSEWYVKFDDKIFLMCESEIMFTDNLTVDEDLVTCHCSAWSGIIKSLAELDVCGLMKPLERRRSGLGFATSAVFRKLVAQCPEYFDAQMIKFLIKYSPAIKVAYFSDDSFYKIERAIKNFRDTYDGDSEDMDWYRGAVITYNYKCAMKGTSGFEGVMALMFSRFDGSRPPVSRLPDDIMRVLVKFLAVKCPYLIPGL